MTELNLAFNVKFEDLYNREGLVKLDDAFMAELEAVDAVLAAQYLTVRKALSLDCPPFTPPASDGESSELAAVSLNNKNCHPALVAGSENDEVISEKEESALIIELAPYLEDFIAKLFGIENEVQALAKDHNDLADLYLCKRLFVQRRAAKICKPADAQALNGDKLCAELEKIFAETLTEESFSKNVMSWLNEKGADIEGCEEKINLAGMYASWALNSEAGVAVHKNGVLFKKPAKLDFENLVTIETEIVDGVEVVKLADEHLRERCGFELTDEGGSLKQALDDANYCIYCHKQGKDSCSKGLREKPDESGKAAFKTSPTGVSQAGCPLEEKISEMNLLKAKGVSIGALGVIAIDNPICAATGHRICNDCMKACIYQKQEPVNIPEVETRTLQDVLDLPYGFEIYSLFTRWNPLNLRNPLPKADTGYKVLVVGLGPAGFALSHNLLNEGHTVIAIDGLKIEPLPSEISGVAINGDRAAFSAIKDVRAELFENLDNRTLYGFGGVAEYGITVRWNKNYLKIIRLLLERRAQFAMHGGVRFGGTITYDKAFEMGFDHVALCMGAGKPTVVSMPNALARGVRTASDFLMSLQLQGAGKKDSIANLQLRLPVVVIGGGLTAVDAATEALAYYPVQVEKFLSRYEILVKERAESAVRGDWGEEETEIAEEFLRHARSIRKEREQAKSEGRKANIIGLMKKWGGAKVAYRKRLIDAPSYRLNHEEVEKALEEGIGFVPNATPHGVKIDQYGHAIGLRINYTTGLDEGEIEVEEKILPARTIFMAAGTSPNTVLAREDAQHFALNGKYFVTIDEDGNQTTPEYSTSKPQVPNVLLSKTEQGKFVSFFGDLHPSYVGNVVKAIGSAKQGYPIISKVLGQKDAASKEDSSSFINKINAGLNATIHDIIRLTPNIIEVVVKAPFAAEAFEPGQFYRLQNFESLALQSPESRVQGSGKGFNSDNRTLTTTLTMEGLALTGAWVDKEKGLLSTIVLEMGGSSDLCAHLKKGEPVVLMGPTGTATEIEANETVILVGGGLGNAVLFSIGKAFRDAGSKVLYFAGYKKKQDRYKVEEIEKAADTIIWCCDEGEFTPERDGDRTFQGNIVQAMLAYGEGKFGQMPIDMAQGDRMICIGSDRMMAAVGGARHTVLKNYLKPDHKAIGSINSPMQCMMKEICAQCLQKHIDPETGERTYVYSCNNQDQELDKVDFAHLNERLKQNTVQEKITAKWIDRSLRELGLRG